MRARAVINCLQSSVAQCATSLRTRFGAHAMYVTDNATGQSGPLEGTAYLKLDRLLAHFVSRGRLGEFLEVLARAS